MATGTYSGTWITDKGEECPLSMNLTQDITLQPPKNFKVTGTVHIDYSCIEDELPEWLPTSEPADVNVSGYMDRDNRLVLASGGCGAGFCIILTLDGIGVPEEGQEKMKHLP